MRCEPALSSMPPSSFIPFPAMEHAEKGMQSLSFTSSDPFGLRGPMQTCSAFSETAALGLNSQYVPVESPDGSRLFQREIPRPIPLSDLGEASQISNQIWEFSENERSLSFPQNSADKRRLSVELPCEAAANIIHNARMASSPPRYEADIYDDGARELMTLVITTIGKLEIDTTKSLGCRMRLFGDFLIRWEGKGYWPPAKEGMELLGYFLSDEEKAHIECITQKADL